MNEPTTSVQRTGPIPSLEPRQVMTITTMDGGGCVVAFRRGHTEVSCVQPGIERGLELGRVLLLSRKHPYDVVRDAARPTEDAFTELEAENARLKADVARLAAANAKYDESASRVLRESMGALGLDGYRITAVSEKAGA